MKKLTIKKSVLIVFIYAAISFGVIEYFNFFPPIYSMPRTVAGITYNAGTSNYDPYYWSILIFGIGAILLIGILFYYTEWKKPPTNDE